MTSIRLSDQVADRIKADIKTGKFKPGDKLPAEPELMKLYEVGRSSVREAVKSLTMGGLLSVQQGSGTFVNQEMPLTNIAQRLHRADFDEINAVRVLLEEEIVRLAVQHHTPADLEAMAANLQARNAAILNEDRLACANADIAFHMAIARASANNVLADLYQYFTLNIRSFFSKREAKGVTHFAMSHHLHADLFTAIKNKREKQALEIIKIILANNY